ncbi:hypothetical protein BXQ17_03190 [Polaribacter sp. BM10]|nr:hypothetical protein BXQ17_03190 [Polaribacter sp. BM10]
MNVYSQQEKTNSPYDKLSKVDKGYKLLSAEAEVFIDSFNENQDSVVQYVNDMGKSFNKYKVPSYVQNEKLLYVINELFDVNRYLAFRIYMVLNKSSKDYIYNNITSDIKMSFQLASKRYFNKKKRIENANKGN